MGFRSLAQDGVIGLISGYVGGRVMNAATTKLQAMESPQAKEQEKRVSPGVSYEIAAKDLAQRAGIHVDDAQAGAIASFFHLGLGLGAGEFYVALRRITRLNPAVSGLTIALLLFGGIDEGITPAMGWSAPGPAYPPATHVRGLLGHLTLGATVLVVAEFLTWLMKPRLS
ncbi:MAG: hypothetical protein ACRDFX_10480 [Chloroflexota bacterium]